MTATVLDRSWDRAGRMSLPATTAAPVCPPCPSASTILDTVELVKQRADPLVRRALEAPDVTVTLWRNGCCYGG